MAVIITFHMNIKPRFIELYRTGELKKRAREAGDLLASCTLCPRNCGVNRLQGQLGFCRSGFLPTVSSYNAHHGEEPPISGTRGSGTIFFSHCNLSCCYCQNWPISQLGQGQEVTVERLAGMMMELQQRGCHNINFVTPSHMTAQILMALEIAVPQGFNLPLVYNTSGYDSLDSLKLLEGVIDIYLPDIRYTDPRAAERYSGAGDYPAVNQAALKEMWRQVGELQLDDQGIAFRGMLVRHLVLPNGLSQTKEALKFLAGEISPQGASVPDVPVLSGPPGKPNGRAGKEHQPGGISAGGGMGGGIRAGERLASGVGRYRRWASGPDSESHLKQYHLHL